jgi:hypothetical protein
MSIMTFGNSTSAEIDLARLLTIKVDRHTVHLYSIHKVCGSEYVDSLKNLRKYNIPGPSSTWSERDGNKFDYRCSKIINHTVFEE